jgi:hypothetical protein
VCYDESQSYINNSNIDIQWCNIYVDYQQFKVLKDLLLFQVFLCLLNFVRSVFVTIRAFQRCTSGGMSRR